MSAVGIGTEPLVSLCCDNSAHCFCGSFCRTYKRISKFISFSDGYSAKIKIYRLYVSTMRSGGAVQKFGTSLEQRKPQSVSST